MRGLGASLPFAGHNWATTKAAYWFFANQRVREAQILSGYFAATRECVRARDGPVLVLQDTTLRYRRISVSPPVGKQNRYPPLSLTVPHARQLGASNDRPRSTDG